MVILNDLFDHALITGYLEVQGRRLPDGYRFLYLDAVSRAGMCANVEEHRGKLICIPVRHDDGELELCFLYREPFLSSFSPTEPQILGALVDADYTKENTRILRRLLAQEIMINHNETPIPRFSMDCVGLFLGAAMPEPPEEGSNEIALAFLYQIADIPWPPPETEGPSVKVIDPIARAITRERTFLRVYFRYYAEENFDRETMDQAIDMLPGKPDEPIVIYCGDPETECLAVSEVASHCRDLYNLAMVDCEDLGRLTPAELEQLCSGDLLLIIGFSGLVLDEDGERELLRIAVERRVPLIVTENPMRGAYMFRDDKLTELFDASVKFELQLDDPW